MQVIRYTLALAALASIAPAVAETRDGAPFVVTFPRGTGSPDAVVWVYLTGPFGGAGWSSSVATSRGRATYVKPDEYAIETTHDGKPATSIKAGIFTPAYGVALVDVPSLDTHPTRRLSAAPQSLPRVRFRGRVVMPAKGPLPAALTLDLVYSADWTCEFFKLADCLVGLNPIASVPLAGDGRFALDVPDFTRDPALKPFGNKGSFSLRAHSDSAEFRLSQAGSGSAALPLSPGLSDLVLTLVAR